MLGDGAPDPFEHIAALESTVGPKHVTLTSVFVQNRQQGVREPSHASTGVAL